MYCWRCLWSSDRWLVAWFIGGCQGVPILALILVHLLLMKKRWWSRLLSADTTKHGSVLQTQLASIGEDQTCFLFLFSIWQARTTNPSIRFLALECLEWMPPKQINGWKFWVYIYPRPPKFHVQCLIPLGSEWNYWSSFFTFQKKSSFFRGR